MTWRKRKSISTQYRSGGNLLLRAERLVIGGVWNALVAWWNAEWWIRLSILRKNVDVELQIAAP